MPSRVVLITGCSSGFGLLTAARLAATGHRVWATMRDPANQQALQTEVRRRGGSVTVHRLDVTDEVSVVETLAALERTEGKLDALINNAGYGLGGPLEEITDAELREQMETNFFGAVRVTRLALPLLRRGESARIINVSSIAGVCGVPGIGAYSASKFAMEGYFETLWHELAPFNIGVVIVEPGTYPTEVQRKRRLAANLLNPASPYYEYSKMVLEATDRRVGRTKADPEEVAALLARLVSEPAPKLRYRVGREARVLTVLKRLLPFRNFARLLQRGLLRE
jgi:NAD(P)-dependent dehydrogenase (short-subunit alcohol dehydrogenase family)